MFRAEAAVDLFGRLETAGYAFDIELLCLARRAGLRVIEVPVNWHDVPGSKVRVLRDGLHMLAALFEQRGRLGGSGLGRLRV